MRTPWRAVAAVSVAAALFGGYGAWRWRVEHRWKHAAAAEGASACPEARSLAGDCAACVAAECCAEIHACYSNAGCIDLNDCVLKCAEGEGPRVPAAQCPAACEARHAASSGAYHAWDRCVRGKCEEACPREEE